MVEPEQPSFDKLSLRTTLKGTALGALRLSLARGRQPPCGHAVDVFQSGHAGRLSKARLFTCRLKLLVCSDVSFSSYTVIQPRAVLSQLEGGRMSNDYKGQERRGQQWLTVTHVAKVLGYTPQTVTTYLRQGLLPGKCFKRTWRIDPVAFS